MSQSEVVFTLAQAAEGLGVSTRTLTRWCKKRLINFFRTPGGEYRFRQVAIELFMRQREVENNGKRTDIRLRKIAPARKDRIRTLEQEVARLRARTDWGIRLEDCRVLSDKESREFFAKAANSFKDGDGTFLIGVARNEDED